MEQKEIKVMVLRDFGWTWTWTAPIHFRMSAERFYKLRNVPQPQQSKLNLYKHVKSKTRHYEDFKTEFAKDRSVEAEQWRIKDRDEKYEYGKQPFKTKE